jgi:phage-related protein
MSPRDKPLVWLRGEVKTPPFGPDARVETGFLLRRLQRGEGLGLPHSRPMPGIGVGCHELRIVDGSVNWRIMYHIAPDAIVILDVFQKKTAATPTAVIVDCRRRLVEFQRIMKRQKGAGHARR